MSIASWLLPVLWREHDWRAALERLAIQQAESDDGPQAQRAAMELGRAFEYIEPDRRRAIAMYELAGPRGDLGRARELAVELGWWSARARLSLAARAADSDPRLVLEEAEAWWDAGHPDLCAITLAGVRRADRTGHALELAALVAERDLAAHAATAAARAAATTGTDAADAYVMAARYARAAGQPEDEVRRWLEAALLAQPGHRVSASFLLALACKSRDPERIQRYLQRRLAGVDPTTWLEGMRTSALALIDTEHHRGFGLRLLRQALERAYGSHHANIPGHLAMWTVLAAHASADGSRRELLPLVITAIQCSELEVDRVWLGALATEISLRDAKHPVVAGAYAEIVAEYAPEHPIVRELVATVAAEAEGESDSAARAMPVPPAAIAAATAKLDENFDVDIELDDAYAEAAEASLVEADLEELVEGDGAVDSLVAPKAAKSAATIAPVAAKPVAPAKPVAAATARPVAASAVAVKPIPAVTVQAAPAQPTPVASLRSIAPASLAKPVAPASSASIVAPSIVKPSSIIPSALQRPSSTKPVTARVPLVAQPRSISASPDPRPRQPTPPSIGSSSVLAALRTPDRPRIPPRAPDPVDASPRARRIAIPIDVRLILSTGTRIDGHSRDISTSGLFVLTSATLEIDAALTIELSLPGEEAFVEDEYRSAARVARRAEGGYGIELVAPDATLLAALGAL